MTVSPASAQENWTAGDADFEARKIERYQQLVDKSPEKSYAFNQLMASVGKGAAYQKLLGDYEKKVSAHPDSFNLRMILGHMYQYGGRTHDALASYRAAIGIKKTAHAYISIAAAEAENRNFEEATAAYEQASALGPSREQKMEILRAQAEIALYRRDMKRAGECFAALIELEPNSLFVRRELSQIYTQNKMYDEARQVLEEAAGLSSASAADRDQIAFDIAQLYEQEGRDDEALRRYEALSAKLGASHWMQRDLTGHIIDIHRRLGTVGELIESLKIAWKSPNYEQNLELADLYEETSDPDRALLHIEKAVKMSPGRPEAREKLVSYYRSHGMSEQMFEAKKALIKAIPGNPDYRFELYEAYIAQKQLDRAMEVIDETVRKFPDDFETQRRAAEAYQMHGFGSKALAVYESRVKKHPHDIEALEALGDLYDGMGARRKAMDTWKKIEDLPMDRAAKLETLARIYDEHGYADESEALYARSLAANPKDCQVHVQYADVLTRSGKHVQAVDAWEKMASACESDPMQITASRRLADIYRARGEQTKALARYKGISDEHPDNARDAIFFARMAESFGMSAEAVPTLESFTARHPENTAALRALSALHAGAGDMKEARSVLEKLASVSETDKREAWLAIVDIDMAQGSLESAAEHLEQALKLNASDAETHERLGDVLMKMRRYREAANNYETAFRIDSRNYAFAFKHATCLSILADDKAADALYVKIVTDSTDESLVMKAAQRVIDDMTWRGGLDELAKSFLPLLRSNRQKTTYLDILLQLADAQSRPLVLAIQTRDPLRAFAARHELRELSEMYSQVIVEGILSTDVSLSNRALELGEWLASSSVISVLGRKIEQAPGTVEGREMQLRAVRSIAHAQLPAAVPVLKDCLSAHYSRALREHALWALGLIPSQNAMDLLRDSLDNSLDSFRALAIIGLGRHGVYLDEVQKLLGTDPSPLVKGTAAWVLAVHRVESSRDAIRALFDIEDIKPHQLRALAMIDPSGSGTQVIEALWTGTENVRTMAAKIMRSEEKRIDLTQLTQPEAVGAFIKGDTTYYMSNFKLDILLENFSELTLSDAGAQAAGRWIIDHADDVAAETLKTAARTSPPVSTGIDLGEVRGRMLRDLIRPDSALGLDTADPAQREVIKRALGGIETYLTAWIDGEDDVLAGLSIQALAVIERGTALNTVLKMARNGKTTSRRIDAVSALALFSSPDARRSLMELAGDDHYLIRAAAVSLLDPSEPDERRCLEKALKDSFLVVSRTAEKRLAVQKP